MKKYSKAWSVAEAKAHFSEVIKDALTSGPQVITRSGVKTVVIVSADEWESKTARKGNLAEFFYSSPLRDSNLKITRSKKNSRSLEL